MIYGTYLSAAGMANEQARIDLIANNLANSETAGFKRILSVYQERRAPAGQPDALARMTGGREMMPTLLDRAQGGLEASDNPLDVALVGDGFLAVEKNGARHLTRDGRLAVNAEGELSLAADPGVRVLDAATDGPIRLGTLTPDQLRIDERGVVRNTADGDAPIGTLSLATADTVRPLGGGLLTATGPTRPAADVQVRGGFVEQSNVRPRRS